MSVDAGLAWRYVSRECLHAILIDIIEIMTS